MIIPGFIQLSVVLYPRIVHLAMSHQLHGGAIVKQAYATYMAESKLGHRHVTRDGCIRLQNIPY